MACLLFVAKVATLDDILADTVRNAAETDALKIFMSAWTAGIELPVQGMRDARKRTTCIGR
ncbi:hypothetical protein PI87_00505 [Ralstonia sp. A12]|uniref:hypothetical protein n=1 Tax=Ralstonia sp. A12 TaxID=1217052 RepID=UPI000574CDA4|nr:hypothetical protein [Ralstonia sp. A12]KHK58277.1 hypothetical protein PI87_00505 [Ralstonia sp. A12]